MEQIKLLKEDFYESLSDRDWTKCEEIIKEIRVQSEHMADLLEAELEDEIALKNAESKGSEDGQDRLQDEYNA